MSEPWNGQEVFGKLLSASKYVVVVFLWILIATREPGRKPWWLVALACVALVALIVYAVLELRSVPSVEPR